MLLLLILSLFLVPRVFSSTNGLVGVVRSFEDRVINVVRRPPVQEAQDSSVNLRVFGSWELALKSSSDSPLLGTGLGGDNLTQVYEKHRDELKYVFKFGEIGIGQIPPEILRATGVLGALVLAALYIAILKSVRSAIIGAGLV